MTRRVVVFGLDAASPFLIQRWMDKLPTFRKLINEGTWGTLRSTIPAVTSPAWSCMATGKNPAKVGIFSLLHRSADSYKLRPPTSALRRTPAVWDLVGQKNKRAIVVNVPDTYPPTPLNGICLSGRPAPNISGTAISSPPEARIQVEEAIGRYQVVSTIGFTDDNLSEGIEGWLRVNESQQMAIEYFMDEESWDLLFYVSMAIDPICHHFWRFLDEEHPDYDPTRAEQYADTILNIYQNEDQRLARVVGRLTEDDLLLIVSDHGSTPSHHHIAVNLWLIEKGYLVLKQSASTHKRNWLSPFVRNLYSLYHRSDMVRRVASQLKNTRLRNKVVQEQYLQRTKDRLQLSALPIDWEQTRAYFVGSNQIYLNVAGREPQGIVKPGSDYDQLLERLIHDLQNATDPGLDKPLFSEVYRSNDIYDGPYLSEAPDLILMSGDDLWSLGSAVGDVVVDRPVVGGKHDPRGVFIAWGADVRKGYQTEASLYDISPTVLHALDLPVPDDGDGDVRLEWFQPESDTAQRPVLQSQVEPTSSEPYELTPEEESEIETILRNLGYMD